jgi:methyl-accepting chemotaxis protein
MKLLQRSRPQEVHQGLDVTSLFPSMLDKAASNIMFADTEFTIRYLNEASRRTLHKIAHLLPIAPDRVLGSSIDIFHKSPQHQRRLLADPSNLPHQARFPLGDEWVELNVEAMHDVAGTYVGAMVNWSIITEYVRTEENARAMAGAVSQAVADMQVSMSEIATSAAESVRVTDQASGAVNDANRLMERLNERLADIDQVVDFIAGVAEQTNLLALNATIEAARAGDVGRGFAVVAGEVKELANETDRATENIRTSVRAVQQEAADMRNALEQMTGLTETVQHNSSQIAAAVEEQATLAEVFSRQASMQSQSVSSH